MENTINLHNDKDTFIRLIKETADYMGIRDIFIEKDYWITLVLKRLSESTFADSVVFKGGTSLSKGYKIIKRFSEDVDIAIIDASKPSGNQLKRLIRNVEKTASIDLEEIEIPGVTSKHSVFRKTIHTYPPSGILHAYDKTINRIIIEVNSFANAYPYINNEIQSFIFEFLLSQGASEYVEKYDLNPVRINILDKKRTLVEKLVSLIRFSFSQDPIEGISGKIRHFYDIHFLLKDPDCNEYIKLQVFIDDLLEIINHDRNVFDEPPGWKNKRISVTPLVNKWNSTWIKLIPIYKSELSALAFEDIPNENDIYSSFNILSDRISDIEK